MNLLRLLGLQPKSRDPLSRPPEQRVYLVDAASFLENRQRNGNFQPHPRDNVQVLRNLAQFAEREHLAMTAVFIGRQLREAAEGACFKSLTVYYGGNAAEQAEKILRLIRQQVRTRDVVLVTDSRPLEREAAALNAACMRATTLQKAMDQERDSGEGGRPPHAGFRSRPPDRRSESPAPEKRPEPEPCAEPDPAPDRPSPSPPSAPPAVSPPPPSAPATPPAPAAKPDPGILELIDPV